MRILVAIAATFSLSTSFSLAQTFPAPVEVAVSAAERFENFTPSFTMRASMPDVGSITMRYDAEKKEWSVLEGDLSSLDKDVQKELDSLKEDLIQPNELTYADAREEIVVRNLITETDQEYIYALDLDAEDKEEMPESMQDAVELKLYLDKEKNHIRLLSMKSIRPFKPAPIAKVETLIVEQEFSTPFPDGPAVITRLYNKASGSALFQKFNDEFTLEFFDYKMQP